MVVPVGGANFGSLSRAFARIGVQPVFSSDPAQIAAASHVILPGVGAAAMAMRDLGDRDLVSCLRALTQPLLGICLGMQLLFEHSEEGDCDLLGLLAGPVLRLAPAPSWPHMGWNQIMAAPAAVSASQSSGVPPASIVPAAVKPGPSAGTFEHHPLLHGISDNDWFYFVHGYAVPVVGDTIATTEFGAPFTSVVARGNVFGTQFHPEKSAAAGRRLLENFLSL